jgi:flagellar motor switch protein FliG
MPFKDVSNRMSKSKKIAAIILSLDNEIALKVLKYLEEADLRILGNEMTYIMDKITPNESNKYIEEFLKELENKSKIGACLSKERFNKLSDADPKMIAKFLQEEHPQTIAVILAHLNSAHAAKILSNLPENLQADVVMRIVKLETVSSEVVNELEKALEEEIKSTVKAEGYQIGGVEPVAEILNNMPKALEEKLIVLIEESYPEIAEKIRKKIFDFEDIIFCLENKDIQTILKEVSRKDLLLALKTATEEVQEKILKNVPQSSAEKIRDVLKIIGPVKLSDVEKARQNIIEIAKTLEHKGKIVIVKEKDCSNGDW